MLPFPSRRARVAPYDGPLLNASLSWGLHEQSVRYRPQTSLVQAGHLARVETTPRSDHSVTVTTKCIATRKELVP